MAKICLYTDNHFAESSSNLNLRGNNYSKRLENQIESLNWVNKISEEKGCSKLICLGDFFDKPILNSEELTALTEIQWNNLPKIFIVGNHEINSVKLLLNSTNALSKIGRVINRCEVDSGYGYEIIYLPYIVESERKDLTEYIDKSLKEYYSETFTAQEVKNRIILSHNDIKGIKYGRIESKTGFSIKEIEENCSLFINGHLHNGDKITDKIINLGNLTGQNFNEDGFRYKHNIMILDTETLEYELIENPYAISYYKEEIKSIKELYNILEKLNTNSILAINIPYNILKECKEILEKSDLLNYKIMTYNNTEIQLESKDIKELTKVNHIQMFEDCFIDKYGSNDIIQEELRLLR